MYQRAKQLLEQIHELEVLDREIKRNNAMLTKRSKELHNSILEMRGMYIMLKSRNLRYMQDNTRLYRMIRLLRLQIKKSNTNPSSQTHCALETLAKEATSFQDLEAAQDVVVFPNPMQPKEFPEDQQQN